MFSYNSIHYFRYMPKLYLQLHVFDQFPLMIPLEIRGQIVVGVNMHWIPGPLRQKTIQLIIEMRNRCINERMFRLYYRLIKFNPNLQFMKIAIRKYYVSHCSNMKIIPADQWDTLVFTAHTLYKARYMQKSGTTPDRHIFNRGRALNPQVYAKPKPQPQQQAPLGTMPNTPNNAGNTTNSNDATTDTTTPVSDANAPTTPAQ